MIPRAIVALADEAPPPAAGGSVALYVALGVAGVALALGLWLAKRRKGGSR